MLPDLKVKQIGLFDVDTKHGLVTEIQECISQQPNDAVIPETLPADQAVSEPHSVHHLSGDKHRSIFKLCLKSEQFNLR